MTASPSRAKIRAWPGAACSGMLFRQQARTTNFICLLVTDSVDDFACLVGNQVSQLHYFSCIQCHCHVFFLLDGNFCINCRLGSQKLGQAAALAKGHLTGAYLALLLRILKYQLSCKAQIKPSLRITLSADGRSLSQREKQGLCLFPQTTVRGAMTFYRLVVLY